MVSMHGSKESRFVCFIISCDIQLFCSVYGCASATAQKWYDRGLRTLDDVQQCHNIELSEVQKIGMILFIQLRTCKISAHVHIHAHTHTYT